jgi:protein TonB
MRLPFVIPLLLLLAACAPPAPPAEPTALDLPSEPEPERDNRPVGELPKDWCYEVGNAPARIKPDCKPSPEACDVALTEARRGGLDAGFGDPFSACRPMRADDFTRPHRLSGKMPVYSHAAREAGVHGRMRVRCTLTVLGLLEKCQILDSMPLMDQAVLEATTTWRYEPVRFVHRAISTTYTIPLLISPPPP